MTERVLLIPLVVLPIGDLAATIFFTWLYIISKSPQQVTLGAEPGFLSRMLGGRSWLLGLLAVKCAIVTANFVFIGWLAFLRLTDRPVEGATVWVILTLIILGVIPIVFMAAFWRSRKRRGSPPPFTESD
jgi:hypothetical protein